MPFTTLSPHTLKALFTAKEEVALLDVREHGEYGESHPFHAVNIPYSRFELLLSRLVPRKNVMMVLFDQADEGRAKACATAAEAMGYTQVQVLSGGANEWEAAGYTNYAGVNVPSKAFGEIVHEVYGTPSITATKLAEWRATGQPVRVLDGRPIAEYEKMSIPGSYACPNGELALRAPHMIPDETLPVVVNCGGRTRSIIGAQTLLWLGISNPTYALENGTHGWRLAGFSPEHGQDRFFPARVEPTPEQVRIARRHAIDKGAITLSASEARIWLTEQKSTTYLFDVRTAEEYANGHLPGAVHAPGGQLMQATDHWVGVTGARVILVDDDGCRAPMVAAWLSLMGIKSAWYSGDLEEWLKYNPQPAPERTRALLPTPEELPLDAELLSVSTLLDCRSSSAYRKGHLPGVQWVNRSLLAQQLASISPSEPIVIVADEEDSARIIAKDLQVDGYQIRGWLRWNRKAVEAAGLTVTVTPETPPDSERLDYLFFVHDRHEGNLDAARRYLEWELGLLEQLDEEERSTFRI